MSSIEERLKAVESTLMMLALVGCPPGATGPAGTAGNDGAAGAPGSDGAAGPAVLLQDTVYVSFRDGNDDEGTGAFAAPFATFTAALDALGAPVSLADFERVKTIVFLDGGEEAADFVVPTRRIRIVTAGGLVWLRGSLTWDLHQADMGGSTLRPIIALHGGDEAARDFPAEGDAPMGLSIGDGIGGSAIIIDNDGDLITTVTLALDNVGVFGGITEDDDDTVVKLFSRRCEWVNGLGHTGVEWLLSEGDDVRGPIGVQRIQRSVGTRYQHPFIGYVAGQSASRHRGFFGCTFAASTVLDTAAGAHTLVFDSASNRSLVDSLPTVSPTLVKSVLSSERFAVTFGAFDTTLVVDGDPAYLWVGGGSQTSAQAGQFSYWPVPFDCTLERIQFVNPVGEGAAGVVTNIVVYADDVAIATLVVGAMANSAGVSTKVVVAAQSRISVAVVDPTPGVAFAPYTQVTLGFGPP